MSSLTDRPGFLRLRNSKPLAPDNLMKAANTLTQRSMRTEFSQVTIKLDISAMADGQQAGLCHFAKTYASLGISQAGNVPHLTFHAGPKITAGPGNHFEHNLAPKHVGFRWPQPFLI